MQFRFPFGQACHRIAAIVVEWTQIMQRRVRTTLIVIHAITLDDLARFIQLGIRIEWHFSAQRSMQPFVLAI